MEDVAGEASAKRRGTRTSSFGVGRREGHDSTAFYERFQAPEISADDHVAPPKCVDRLIVGDARHMVDVADNSVALVVTSPPYFAGKEYEEALGHGHIPATYIDYLQQLCDVFAECVRVLEPGGRLAVNVANLGRRPYRSLSADVTAILQDDLRLLMRGEVLWVKQRGAAGNCAWGSFQRPGNPVLRDLSERVIIASKGRFDRAITAKDRAKIGLPSISSMTRDEFMEATVDVWEIPPERANRVGHPAPFPVGLPERLIHMNTYVGDLVLDPFVGSGTTAVAAARTGRSYIGYDTDSGYIEAAQRRLADDVGRAAEHVDAVGLLANDGRKTDRLRGGWSSKEIAKQLLTDAGFSQVDDGAVVMPAVVPTLRAIDPNGRTWWFEVVGGRTSNRPGAQRLDLLWRAIAKGAILREVDPSAGFAILTVDQPTAASGGKALAAVTGPGRPVVAIVDMLSLTAVSALAELGKSSAPPS
ncbi:MAG: site-specific DNA-methyltransferase [Ilumatobacteraceae bacterium]